MAQFTIYRSTDVGAPVLNGTLGSLITVLDAVLVNGYGSKTAAGWTKPYSSSNNLSASYKQGSGSSGMYLWVMDGPGGAYPSGSVVLKGFLSMSSANGISGSVGSTNPFPSQGQSGVAFGGVGYLKSEPLGSSITISWIAAVDSKTLYFFSIPLTAAVTTFYNGFMFGDIVSYCTGSDPYKCALIAQDNERYITTAADCYRFPKLQAFASTITAHYIGGNYLGVAGSYAFGKMIDSVKGGVVTNDAITGIIGNGVLPLPNSADGKLYLSPINILEYNGTNYITRGRLRGAWSALHPYGNLSQDGIINNIGPSNMSILVIRLYYVISAVGGAFGTICIETSNTLD